MSNGDALAQLKDIHLPPPISWWPIAPGWYGLVGLVVSLLLAGFFVRRFYCRGRAKREGLRLLLIYEKQAQQGDSSAVICAQVTELLRRVALVYFPRQDIAGLQGDDWIMFLNQTGKRTDFMSVRSLLLDRPYQSSAGSGDKEGSYLEDLTPLFTLVRIWIKQRGAPCSN